MFHMKHPPTYKDLMVKRDAFMEFRQRIDLALTGGRSDPMEVDFDDSTGDVLATGTFDGVQRTYRLTITEETTDVPRETSTEDQ